MSKTTKPPSASAVARWVFAVSMDPPAGTASHGAAAKRRRAQNARANLAKHNLGANGLPLGRIQ